MKDRPMLQSPAPIAAPVTMKHTRIAIIPYDDTFLLSESAYLTYMIFMQMRVMMLNELDRSLVVASIIVPGAKILLEMRKIMPTRKAKAALIARIIHLRNCADRGLDSFLPLRSILDRATMLHPRISVVRAVANAWMARAESMMYENRTAPAFPSMYPIRLTTIMLDALNSALNPFLTQIRSAIVMVRIVSRSSSSTPDSLHARATTACRKANIWIIHPTFIFPMFLVCLTKITIFNNISKYTFDSS